MCVRVFLSQLNSVSAWVLHHPDPCREGRAGEVGRNRVLWDGDVMTFGHERCEGGSRRRVGFGFDAWDGDCDARRVGDSRGGEEERCFERTSGQWAFALCGFIRHVIIRSYQFPSLLILGDHSANDQVCWTSLLQC